MTAVEPTDPSNIEDEPVFENKQVAIMLRNLANKIEKGEVENYHFSVNPHGIGNFTIFPAYNQPGMGIYGAAPQQYQGSRNQNTPWEDNANNGSEDTLSDKDVDS